MAQRDQGLLLGLIDKLYAAAVDSTLVIPFLAAAAVALKSDNACLGEIGAGQRGCVVLHPAAWDAIQLAHCTALIADVRSRPAARAGLQPAAPRQLGATTETLPPRDTDYALVVDFPGEVSHWLGFTRNPSGRRFNAHDGDLLAALAPHVGRALAIRQALDRARPHAPIRLPDGTAPDAVTALARSFGLSPAQARLTMHLVNGKRIRDAADDLGITEGSARQYLKKIFDKTGAHRQVDLIRVVDRALAGG